jgi:uncharacterized protein (TIGR02271 family)
MKDIIAFYRRAEDAREAREELITAGFDADDIRTYDDASYQGESGHVGTPDQNEGFWDKVKEWFGFADESDRSMYGEATRRGNCSVTVRVPDDEDLADDEEARVPGPDIAMAILRRHDPIDLDTEVNRWRSEGWRGTEAATTPVAAQAGQTVQSGPQQFSERNTEGEQSIPVTQEQLRVGKRVIQEGGIRIHTRVTEQPVEEQVNLRKEHVEVERRPVDRPATGDENAFQERVIEEAEISEEPVVQKEARVVEEVAVRKDVDQRTETVRDTVRRTDVDVERLNPGQLESNTAARTAGDDNERTRCETFANELASDERYRGRDFNEIESDARRSYEQRNPGQTWERVKDKVRDAFDRVRGKSKSRT